MKRILYLSFYFKPDLCAGSFRNSSLIKQLVKQTDDNTEMLLITTMPNRYSNYTQPAKSYEKYLNLKIVRINIPNHNNNFLDQIFSFSKYFYEVKKMTRKYNFDLVFASSSRLFTAYLGSHIAKKNNSFLYLDIRDIFVDTLNDLLKNKFFKFFIINIVKFFERKTFSNADHINLISKGFNDYFKKYKYPTYSNFSNGIDKQFLNVKSDLKDSRIKIITYAGNIGAGQGLHKIIPEAAKLLENNFRFKIVGSGSYKNKLIDKINELNLDNVELIDPVDRKTLESIYLESHYLFLHLNNYNSFKKVLPSKIFELGSYPQPLIAGVSGFAKEFISNNLSNFILFNPCDTESFVKQIIAHKYKHYNEKKFKSKFSRLKIDTDLSQSILSYLK